MKLSSLPICAAVAAAFVLPATEDAQHAQHAQHALPEPKNDPASIWDTLGAAPDAIRSAVDESLDHLTAGVESVVSSVDNLQRKLRGDLADALGGGHHHHHHHREFPEHSLYDLIKASNHTKKFAALVDEHEDIADLLKGQSGKSGQSGQSGQSGHSSGHGSGKPGGNHTLFVPLDSAFDRIPDDHGKPGKEFVEALLRYHVGVGDYSARTILGTNTIPTALGEEQLGDEAQRLRTGVGLGGVKLNFYSRVVAADFFANNGVLHAVDSILVPPPMIGRILTLFPGEFSTLLLAYDKTDFVRYVHGVDMVGATVFAPSNKAFARLGVKANAFLFNTKLGLKYLKALLKYHVAPDAVLYSNAFYDNTRRHDDDKDDVGGEGWHREHFDLGTLLGGTHVGVDTATFAGFTVIKVNGFVNVYIRDVPGRNGVIHVVDKVLLPPRKHGHHQEEEEEEEEGVLEDIPVEELMERLAPYVERQEELELELELEL